MTQYPSKRCFKCGEEKPLDDFYKHPAMADGHLGKCKECTKKDATDRRWKNIQVVREYDRERGNRGHRAMASVKHTALWRKADKRRQPAQNKVAKLIKKGDIKKADICEVCGKGSRQMEAHHEDYSYPLNFIWLCCSCHRQNHLGKTEAADEIRAKVKELYRGKYKDAV